LGGEGVDLILSKLYMYADRDAVRALGREAEKRFASRAKAW